MPSEFFCTPCAKSFSSFSTLRKHVKLYHPDRLEELAPIKIKYQCIACSQGYRNFRLFKRHLETHGIYPKHKEVQKCPLCDWKDIQKELLIHFKESHNVDIKTVNKKFQSLEEFYSWKSEIERATYSTFVNNHGKSKTRNHIKIRFRCNRSGNYKTRGVGLRQYLPIKMNAFCPASMFVTVTNESCSVLFTETHLGHENDLGLMKNVQQQHGKVRERNRNSNKYLSSNNCETQIVDDLNNGVKIEKAKTLKRGKKTKFKDFLARHSSVSQIDETKMSNEVELTEVIEGSEVYKIQEYLSQYKYVEDNYDTPISEAYRSNEIEVSETLAGRNRNNNIQEFLSLFESAEDNYETQLAENNFNFVEANNEIQESEDLAATNENNFQEYISLYQNIDVAQNDCEFQIAVAEDAFQLVVDNNDELVVDDTSEFVDDNGNILEKPETLEELKENIKRTFLEALDKAVTYEQCEEIRKIIAPMTDNCDLDGGKEDSIPTECVPEEGMEVGEELDLTTKFIAEGGEDLEELYHPPDDFILERREEIEELGTTLANCFPEEGIEVEEKLDPTPNTFILDVGNGVLNPAQTKYIPEGHTQVEEVLLPTLGDYQNCDEKQSVILRYKPLAYKCIFIKKKC